MSEIQTLATDLIAGNVSAGSTAGGGDAGGRGAPSAAPPPESICRAGTLADLDPEELAAAYGTPLYVYDLDVVSGQVERLRACLPEPFDVAYACKANPALGMIAHLAHLDLGADVASEGELEAALRAGMRNDRIVVTGPGKADALLLRAVRAGLRAVTIESPAEFERLERFSAQLGRRTPILIRLAAGQIRPAETPRAADAADPGKFGMAWDDARQVARGAMRSPHVELIGLHAFGASNVLDPDGLSAHVAATVERALTLAVETGFRLRLVDVGGGLGIPYASDERPLDLGRFGARLHGLAATWDGDRRLAEMRVLLEPGRFLVARAGAYLTRVVDVKTLAGRTVAVVDGGIHHLLRPALIGREHRMHLFTRNDLGGEHSGGPGSGPGVSGTAAGGSGPAPAARVMVAGPLCTGLDIFGHAAGTRAPAVGELIAVLDAGAYGFTESMPYFLSHTMPAEVAVRGGEARLLRPRLEPAEMLAHQRMPVW